MLNYKDVAQTFDFESTNIAPSSEIGDHIFITGLARSGTTILLNALYKSDVFASQCLAYTHTIV